MSELKFDRERFDRGEMPTRTRGGGKVLHVHDSGLDVDYPISAWIDGHARPFSFGRGGSFSRCGQTTDFDLVHEPKTRKVRVAITHRDAGGSWAFTEDEARRWGVSFDVRVRQHEGRGDLIQILEVEVPA